MRDVKMCQNLPSVQFLSATMLSKSLMERLTLFIFAIFSTICLASTILPLFINHLGDSGISLKKLHEKLTFVQYQLNVLIIMTKIRAV